MTRIIYTLIFSFSFLCLTAQIEISLPNTNVADLSGIYNLEINNTTGIAYMAFLEIELRKDNQLVYEATSNQFSLVQSIVTINANVIQPIQVKRNNLNALSGSYTMDVRLKDAASQQILVSERISLDAIENSTGARSESSFPKFQYSGQANIYGQVSNMQGVGSFVPQNYLRAEIHPDFSFSGIPIGLDVLYSTEQNAFRQSMNQVALRFDTQQFKQEMQKKLQSKVKEIDAIGSLEDVNKLNDLKQKVMDKKFPNLSKWEEQLKDPAIQNGLQQIKQLEALDQVLESAEVQNGLKRQATLALKKTLSIDETAESQRLQSFISEINKLQSKAAELRALAGNYEQYKGLNDKVKEAKKFANKDLLKDPGFLKDGIKSLKLMSKPQEILNGFEAITIGTYYPFYSRLSMSSLSVNGINVAWNPGKLYLAATYGLSTRMTYNTDFYNPVLTLPQTAMAAKFGYGSPNANHLHFTYVNISDKIDEKYVDNKTKPKSNKILGSSAQLAFLDNKIKVGGEVMASVLTRDRSITTPSAQDFNQQEIPLRAIMGISNNTSSFDVAWRVFTDLNVFGNGTKIKGFVERIGANYYALGAPTLLNDLLRWKTEVKQNFFKNRLSFSAFARQDNNHLNPLLTSSRSTTRSFGLSGAANLPKWPSLSFSFAPYAQNSEVIATNEDYKTNATMLQLSLGYPLQITKLFSTYSQLTYLSQNLNSNIAAIDYNLKMYGLNETLTYKRNSLNCSVNYTPNQIINQENREVLTLSASASAQVFNKLNTSLGLQYLTVTGVDSRTGYYANASYPITSFADFDLRIKRNIYAAQIEGTGYRDAIAWGGLRLRW